MVVKFRNFVKEDIFVLNNAHKKPIFRKYKKSDVKNLTKFKLNEKKYYCSGCGKMPLCFIRAMKKLLPLPSFQDLTNSDILKIALLRVEKKDGSVDLFSFDIIGKLVECGKFNYYAENNIEKNGIVYGIELIPREHIVPRP